MAGRVVILMGSKSDLDHVNKMVELLDEFAIEHDLHVASAHKSVRHLLELLDGYNSSGEQIVFLAVAGRSNALAGMVDANTPYPVITSPPTSSAFGGADIYSSLRMPSGVAPGVVLDPAGAALAAAKVLALSDATLMQRVVDYQQKMTDSIVAADCSLQ